MLQWIVRGYYWLAERLYNELAFIYDPVSWLVSLGRWDMLRKWALDYIPGKHVLEIGFGTGELLIEMKRRGLEAYGVELSPSMQRQVTGKLKRSGLYVPRIRGVAQYLPFSDGTFDAVISTYPSSYIFDPHTWSEAARVLRKPDPDTGSGRGRFIIVGIGVSSSGRSILPLSLLSFASPWGETYQHCKNLADAAGLELSVLQRRYKTLVVPVLVAELPE